jgi:hypothetical protein
MNDSKSLAVTSLIAYPNPFRTMTNIRVTPAESGKALLEVFDVHGRAIKRLFEGNVEAGQARTFSFGSTTLASGVYIIRLSTNTKVTSQKITLVK